MILSKLEKNLLKCLIIINNFFRIKFRHKSGKSIYFKEYPRAKKIILPSPFLPNKISFKRILYERKSGQKFKESNLSLTKLSSLLYFSAGLRKKDIHRNIFRFYPSGGARYPLEVYLLSLNTDLPKGTYHYLVKSHSLEKINTIKHFIYYEYFRQLQFSSASCFIVITCISKRTTDKYGKLGHRLALIEAGHLGQNIYLNSTALGISCCAIGENGYRLNNLLKIDGLEESIIYIFAIGLSPTT